MIELPRGPGTVPRSGRVHRFFRLLSHDIHLLRLAIAFRCNSQQTAEDAGEMTLGLKSDLSGDAEQRGLTLAQQLLSAFHSLPHYVLMRSCACTGLKQLGKVVLAHRSEEHTSELQSL